MKTLLYIYLGISILATIMYIFSGLKAAHEFKRRYPNLERPKTPLVDKIFIMFKGILIHFIPLLNVLLIYAYLFRDEELEERVIEKMYSKLSKEATDK